jgi:hypothetical protein
MVSRVLVALAALIALAHADSNFNLRFQGTTYETVSATDALDCFSKTNMTVDFSYGFTYDPTSDTDVTTEGYGVADCETNGRVNMYADMVWAFPRGSVDNADAQCLRFSGAASPSAQKPDATKTTFNQNFKYAITRSLQVCAYDSNWKPWNPASSTTGRDKTNKQNDEALPKISYQSDTWKIFSSKWNEDLATNGDWSAVSTWCAGNCGGAGLQSAWTNPSNQLYDDKAYNTDFDAPQEAFVGGTGDEFPDCVGKSEWRCPAGQKTSDNKNCGFETTTAADKDYKDPLSSNTAEEQIACGSSASLLARSALFSSSDISSSSSDFNKVAGSSMATKIGSQIYKYTFKASDLDAKVGIHQDIVGANGLWSKITQFAPTITHFNGGSVSSPEFSSKTFWLNNANTLKFKFANGNAQYQQIGFSAAANSANQNKIYVADSLASAGTTPPLQQVAFNRDTQEATFLANKGRFSNANQGSGNIGSVGNHYWAHVQSSYTIETKWTCNNLGSDDPNSGTGEPYRFYCDAKLAQWTSTPGQDWNKPSNQNPTLKRQFTKTLYKNWVAQTISATSDPVYIGMFASATNAGYSVADSVPAVNGDAARGVSPSEERQEKQAVAQEDQASGVALIGAGVVVLAVFGSIAICLGAAILGKLQAK